MNSPDLVVMTDIHKAFGRVQALRGADLRLAPGEALGLVGDNAAGKSTLMKILTGAYKADGGAIHYGGQRVSWGSPHDSRDKGIEMVYQDLALAGNMDVVANIFMGRELIGGRFPRLLDERSMEREAERLLERLKIQIPSVRLGVENLSGGQRQAIAIARAVAFQARVVIMDEPTAALAVREVGKVLETVRSLREHGIAVIVISHRLQDIFQVCDRIMVLRAGRTSGERAVSETSPDEIVSLMVGAMGGES